MCLTALGLHGQQRACVVTRNKVIRGFDFIVQARDAANVLIRQDCEREVDQEDQSDGGMQEVSQEGGFETTDGRVGDNLKYKDQHLHSPLTFD